MARALAADPRLLLLDEPLAALDAEQRPALRAALADVLQEVRVATLLVTHDPVDAVALADRVVVLEGGVVVQRGTPTEVLTDPHTSYVASLTGATVWTPSGAAATASGLAPCCRAGSPSRRTRPLVDGPARRVGAGRGGDAGGARRARRGGGSTGGRARRAGRESARPGTTDW